MRRNFTTLAIAAAAMLPAVGSAHHSFAMFDNQTSLTLEGVVKELQWSNPHVWIQIMVADETGKQQEWSLEGASSNNLVRQGWTRNSLKPGDKAVIVIHPLKDLSSGHLGGSFGVVTVNGKRIGTGGNAPTAPAPLTPAGP